MRAKSRAVRELIKIIYERPEIFKADSRSSFSSAEFKIGSLGGTRLLSVADLYIEGKEFPLSYRDAWALEVAHVWWCTNAPLLNYVDMVNE